MDTPKWKWRFSMNLFDQFCIRFLTMLASYLLGFRTSKDETKAEELLKEVFKDRSLPDIVRARAASHLACIYHGRFAAEEVDVSDAMPVLAFSSTSVDMGLTSPNILRIVRAWVLARSHKVGEHPVVAPLWAALDARDKEMEEEREFRYRKVKRAPNKYQCANPACSIQSLRRGPLKKCAGKCDADVKPYYCERSCQVAVSIVLLYTKRIVVVHCCSSTGSSTNHSASQAWSVTPTPSMFRRQRPKQL